MDSTVKTVYGNQEGADKGYNPKKKGANSYHRLLAFCVDTKEILQGWLRPGSTYTGNGIVEFMSQLAAQLPTGLKIILRGDSGFFSGQLLDFRFLLADTLFLSFTTVRTLSLRALSKVADGSDEFRLSRFTAWLEIQLWRSA